MLYILVMAILLCGYCTVCTAIQIVTRASSSAGLPASQHSQQCLEVHDYLREPKNVVTSVKDKGDEIIENLEEIKRRLLALESRLNTKENCTSQTEELQRRLSELESRLKASGANWKIGFHATLLGDTSLKPDEILQPWQAITNSGNAFNNSTGHFAAPVSGMYFFVASTGSFESENHANLRLMADGYPMDGLSNAWVKRYSDYWNMGSVHAVLHLNRDQRAWLTCHHVPCSFDAPSTSFSGFLIG